MKCRICGNEERNVPYRALEMMFGSRLEFDYFQCAICECLQILEIPGDMRPYYPRDYYSFSPLAADSLSLFSKNVLLMKSLLKSELPRSSRILDVGCGNGEILSALARIGFKDLRGIDPHIEKDLALPNGVRILKGHLRDLTASWDVIMFHHSFEHMQDPLETLLHVAGLLTSNGICLVRIPIVSSYAWEHYRAHWVQLDAPRHFFLHSLKSINLLAGKTGFRVKEIVYDSSSFQFWGSEQYLKGIPLNSERSWHRNPAQSIFTAGDEEAFKKKANQLNLEQRGDQAAFYLVRI